MTAIEPTGEPVTNTAPEAPAEAPPAPEVSVPAAAGYTPSTQFKDWLTEMGWGQLSDEDLELALDLFLGSKLSALTPRHIRDELVTWMREKAGSTVEYSFPA